MIAKFIGWRSTPAYGRSALLRALACSATTFASALVMFPVPALAQTADAGDDANTIIVTAHAYKPVDPSPAAKIKADNHDLPISVDQVTASLLADRAVTSTDEAIDTVAGVRLIPGFPGSSGFLIRGFFETYDNLVDGFRDQAGQIDPQGIERFDILKGPPSVLYGSQSAGGVVGIVTKSPQPRAGYSLDLLGGSFGDWRVAGDLNQPFADGKVLTRLNFAIENSDTFHDFGKTRARFIAPAVTLKPTERDTITIKGDYDQYNYNIFEDYFISPRAKVLTTLPVSRSISEPGLPLSRSHEWRISGEYVHAFGSGWELRSALGYNKYAVNHGLSRVYYNELEADNRTLDRSLGSGPQGSKSFTAQEELFGHFETGFIHHEALVGLEYYKKDYDYIVLSTPAAPLDIYNPIYGKPLGPTSFSFAGGSGDHAYAGYAQDLMSLGDHLKLLASVRYDHDVAYYEGRSAAGALTYRVNDTNNFMSPRLGIVYQPVKATSLYFNWSKSFYPQIFYYTLDGSILPPDHGEQYEAGVKQDLLNRKLTLTAAVYQLTRRNVATPNPINPNFYINSGEQRARGVELSATGEIKPGWNIQASYAYTDAKITRDNSLPVGQHLGGVPKNAFSLWTQYEITHGAAHGLGGGVGVFYASDRQASIPNTFVLDGYTRVDALVYYRFNRHYRLALNVKNLNNVRYFETDGGYVFRPAAPRSFLASLRAEF